jgi:hypothetical protein
MAWRVLDADGETASNIDGSCEYTGKVVTERKKGVVHLLGGWGGADNFSK